MSSSSEKKDNTINLDNTNETSFNHQGIMGRGIFASGGMDRSPDM